MTKMLFILLIALTSQVNAEVFKCLSATGNVEYRPVPCQGRGVQKIVDIKPPSVEEQQQAQEKLQAWRMQEAVNEKAKYRAEKERQAELAQQRHLNALERQAQATENLSETIKEQNRIGEIEHQNRLNRYNSVYISNHHYGSNSDRNDEHRYRHGHEGRHERRHDQNLQHNQLGDYGPYRPQGSLGGSLGEYGPVRSPNYNLNGPERQQTR